MGKLTDDMVQQAADRAAAMKNKVNLRTRPLARLVQDGPDSSRWSILVHVLATNVDTGEDFVVGEMVLRVLDFGMQALAPTLALCAGAAETLIKQRESRLIRPVNYSPNNGIGQ